MRSCNYRINAGKVRETGGEVEKGRGEREREREKDKKRKEKGRDGNEGNWDLLKEIIFIF